MTKQKLDYNLIFFVKDAYIIMGSPKHAPGLCCLLCFVDLLPHNQAAHLAGTQLWVVSFVTIMAECSPLSPIPRKGIKKKISMGEKKRSLQKREQARVKKRQIEPSHSETWVRLWKVE